MKSEHRHELAENDLSKLLDKGRDRVEPHLNKIVLGLIAVAVVVVGGITIFRTQGAVDMRGATELANASTAADYDKVADDFNGTLTGHWARLRAGEQHLREGLRLSLTNRSASNEHLEQAQQSLQLVLKGSDVPRELREKALYGLAVTLESLTSEQTTTKPAIEAYQQLLTEFPESRYKGQAESRIAALERTSAQEFYAWFHAQNPKPDDRPQPRDFPQLPFGGDTGNPFEGSEPPADMPAEVPAAGGADATAPEVTTDPAPTDDGTEPPAPPSSDRSSSSADGPTLPAAPEPTPEPAADESAPTPESN